MAGYLEETIISVIEQGYPNLEYIIIDGGSTDGSVDIIHRHEKHLAYWVSEPDGGMYQAIRKGFDRSTGEIMGWINADDLLQRKSLFAIARCFENEAVKWVQGINSIVNQDGVIVNVCKPFNVTRYSFLCYRHLGGKGLRSFGTIQQESTYWRRDLWVRAGGLDLTYKYAGDFALWMAFFRFENLYLANTLLGAFRKRPGQISESQLIGYVEETKRCIRDETKLLSLAEQRLVGRFRLYEKVKSSIWKSLIRLLDPHYRRCFTAIEIKLSKD